MGVLEGAATLPLHRRRSSPCSRQRLWSLRRCRRLREGSSPRRSRPPPGTQRRARCTGPRGHHPSRQTVHVGKTNRVNRQERLHPRAAGTRGKTWSPQAVTRGAQVWPAWETRCLIRSSRADRTQGAIAHRLLNRARPAIPEISNPSVARRVPTLAVSIIMMRLLIFAMTNAASIRGSGRKGSRHCLLQNSAMVVATLRLPSIGSQVPSRSWCCSR